MNDFLKTIPVLCLFGLFFSACSPNKEDNTSKETDTITQVPDTSAMVSQNYYGTYTGTIPCASCPGIETTLTLNKDNTFVLKSLYLDEEDTAFVERGKYFVNDNIVHLKTGEDSSFYKLGKNKLYMLDKKKQKVEGALADAYILHKEIIKEMKGASKDGFSGSYTSQAPNTGYSQTLEVTAVGAKRYRVTFSAPDINGEPGCAFTGQGKVENDTLKITLTELDYPAIMVLVQRDHHTIEVFTEKEKDTHTLMSYCSGGATLAGSYRTVESYANKRAANKRS